MNRQTFLFLLLLIIFLDLPRGGPDADSEKNIHVLEQYRATLIQGQKEVLEGDYHLGYGNLTGLKLSYDDSIAHRNISGWPFRNYSASDPWRETQKDSILPDLVSGKVRDFWAKNPVTDSGVAYPLNISSDLYGEFQVPAESQRLEAVNIELPPYLKEYYNSYRQARYDEEKQRYEQDPENNSPPAEVPETLDKIGNVSFTQGNLALKIQPLHAVYPELQTAKLGLELHEGVSLVHVNVEIADSQKSSRNEFAIFAVYFQETGSLVGLSRSAKFMGTHALPHFAMSDSNFKRAKTLIGRLLSVANIEKDVSLEDVTVAVERAEASCELVLYLQLHKTAFTREELMFIDDELKLRQGLPLPKKIPEVEVDHALLYSPDCGLVFEKKSEVALTGIRSEVRLSQLRRVLVGVLVLTLAELNLFMRQAKASRTPSDLSNVSTLCIGLLSGYDSIVAVLMMSIMWLSDLYLICACNTVLNILLFYVFELRYYSTIEAAQSNERGTSWWQILRSSGNSRSQDSPLHPVGAHFPTQTTNVTDGVTNPEPLTGIPNIPPAAPVPAEAPPQAATPPTPTVTGPSSSSVMSYFAFSIILSFGVTLLILNATTWSVNAVRIFEYWLLLLVNSYWIPQFLRNTLKNRPKSISWEFVIGTSMVRLLPLSYLCLDSKNPFRHPRNPFLLLAVFSWISVQIFLLYLQSKLGARFWLNSKWLPEQYNYHPVICLKDLESGFSRDILSNLKTLPEQEVSMYESDCAICMSTLKFPVAMAENGNKKSLEALMKQVMITPCYHSFHSECLEDWMIYKLQCPVCRTALPPI